MTEAAGRARGRGADAPARRCRHIGPHLRQGHARFTFVDLLNEKDSHSMGQPATCDMPPGHWQGFAGAMVGCRHDVPALADTTPPGSSCLQRQAQLL